METKGLSRALSVISRPKPSVVREDSAPLPPPPQAKSVPHVERVVDPVMGQQGPQPVPQMAPAPVAPADKVAIPFADAQLILNGLQETLRLVDGANETGWTCFGANEALFYQGRVLRDRLAQFVQAGNKEAQFEISKTEVAAADQILACSGVATATTPNKNAYIALGVIVAGAAIFLSVVS